MPYKNNATCIRVENELRRIAYFSMEIGIDPKIPTYSGGLGVLAGDTIRSLADLKVAAVGVTLLYRNGYFKQKIGLDGEQYELPDRWDPEEYLVHLPEKITLRANGRDVTVQAWQYMAEGMSGYCVPVLFLDTDLPENRDDDRSLTHHLYGGDVRYRLAQEMVLGIGGVRMLRALGYANINRYHMNEGHSSFLTLELMRERRHAGEELWDIEGVRPHCIFTTHTPVAAGHDKFPYPLVREVMGDDYVPLDVLQLIGGRKELNMTLLALNLSNYINGVAKEHGKVSREMFPRFNIDYITNGVHSQTWMGDHFRELYATFIPGWAKDPFILRSALSIPGEKIWGAHASAKGILLDYIFATTRLTFDRDVFTIGFARRATAYKRATLLFRDPDRLRAIVRRAGKLQLVFAGKAHPKDFAGKEMIMEIISYARQLAGTVPVVYLENYNMDLAKTVTSGVDLWLNTPRKPWEASGTSGMKAAHNGVPSFSILDGWWLEGCIEGLTGWAVDTRLSEESNDEEDAASLYDKLEYVILPMFYNRREEWLSVMRHAIGINASFFNTYRMVQQYVLSAYFTGTLVSSDDRVDRYAVSAHSEEELAGLFGEK